MNLETEIKAYGCHDIVLLEDKPHYRHLDYLDLLKPSGNGSLMVNAIAEFQSRPMLYIVSNDSSKGDHERKKILDLQCLLANRGERAYLAVLSPGEMNVYPTNLDRSVLDRCREKTVKQKSPEAPLFFQSVVSGLFDLDGQPDSPDYIFETILNLMTKSSEDLIKQSQLNPLDVLSFLGRALFFRFLWDRKIILPNELPTICPQARLLRDCFNNVKNSVATCDWLDKTFNGDMLPLSGDYEATFNNASRHTEEKIFLHLQAILEGWNHIEGASYQKTLDWGDLDFAHIPIGVLSQVYEKFSKIWDPQQSKQTSAYYTPKNIARHLVDDAFEGVANKKDAQILDPSCGAGIFLVLAFRKLVAAHWEQDGDRPGTKTIQSILYNQLCGFDISESALRLAALSLYITAIELNGTPRPPKSLKFPKPLQGSVLHNYRRSEEESTSSFVLGSLRPDISDAFNDRFDIVIGNPPWSRLRGDRVSDKNLNKRFTELTRQILTNRGLEGIAWKYHNPDNDPDLPFLWRSTQWAKPGGIIAMALPGRIFLKQTEGGTSAFSAILRGIEITGILNGSNLSDSAVWPGMNQPFMLFFARNQKPPDNHHFYFVTPHFENHLNEKGRIRIDYQSAQPVAASETEKKPWLLKALAVGTILDSEIVQKLDNLGWPTVESYWKNHGLYSGRGYELSPKQKQSDASFMLHLPDFIPPANEEFSIDLHSLDKCKHRTALRPRCEKLYTPPLLIVPESPGGSPSSPKSWIARKSIVFSKSYYGFSAHGSVAADWLIALLHLLTHSELFSYHVLMTSSRMGAERRTFLKENIESFPFPTTDILSNQQRQRAVKLSDQLENASDKPWEAINNFIFDLYGLDKYDRHVIRDTLDVGAPFKKSRQRANSDPTKTERHTFRAELRRLIAPFFSITNESVSIEEIEPVQQNSPSSWYFISIAAPAVDLEHASPKNLVSQIIREANKTGCSRAIVHEKGRLLLGIIGQYRYWTLSRARLCAMDIIRHHLDHFPIGKN